MMSVYRDGSIWTCHTIAANGKAGCRWYELAPDTLTLIQSGTVADNSLYYFFPSIMVNEAGSAAMGFSGSNADRYAGAYYTGRRATHPPGEMAPPARYKAGGAPQNNFDSFGRNRWGDYSYTTLDPVDETTIWTIQEYAHSDGPSLSIWGTYIAALIQGDGDCNENGIPDPWDLDCGLPGSGCDLPGCGASIDCNSNSVPDDCELQDDCNNNGAEDICDIYAGTSFDCNYNTIPDECEADCNENGLEDGCDLEDGTSEDCSPVYRHNCCEIRGDSGCSDSDIEACVCDLDPSCCSLAWHGFCVLNATNDCAACPTNNEIPDECDIASGTSEDCTGNGIPDECEHLITLDSSVRLSTQVLG